MFRQKILTAVIVMSLITSCYILLMSSSFHQAHQAVHTALASYTASSDQSLLTMLDPRQHLENGKWNNLVSNTFQSLGFINQIDDVDELLDHSQYVDLAIVHTPVSEEIIHHSPLNTEAINQKRLNNRIIVSYTINSPKPSTPEQQVQNEYQQCLDNLDHFLTYGVDYEQRRNITYVFSLLGESKPSPLLQKVMGEYYSNIIVKRSTIEYPVDLFAHGKVIEENLHFKDIYFFISCNSRGPYYTVQSSSNKVVQPNHSWMNRFIEKLWVNDVEAVSPTISCEHSIHLQNYALAMTKSAALVALSHWSPMLLKVDSEKITAMIERARYGLTNTLLTRGYNIASLDSRFLGRDFRLETTCDPEYLHLSNSKYANPSICYDHGIAGIVDTPGCRGIHPCETVFLKYDEQILDKDRLSFYTVEKLHDIDQQLKSSPVAGMCTQSYLHSRPYWNIPYLYQNVSQYHLNKFDVDKKSTILLLIRAHAGYVNQLIGFLWLLESFVFGDHQIHAIIIPTEKGSAEIIETFIDNSFKRFRSKHVRRTVMHVPDWIYENYGHFIDQLCTPAWKQEVVKTNRFTIANVGRFCTVNSPLHYLLVDIALYYGKNHCEQCQRLIVTNADNYYSPKFFSSILSESNKKYDIIMTNMVTRGYLLRVLPEKGRVDLGAYTVSFDFLKRTGITFLNSLPLRPEANDYHDADGHFLVRLASSNSSILTLEEYLFYHN